MTRVAVALIVVLGACMSPVMTFGSGKSATEAQHETMHKVTPPMLVVDPDWTGPITSARIRVWADDDYRAQHLHWQQAFAEQLDYANAVLRSQFGVELVPEYRDWHRHAPGVALVDSLEELRAEDPGDGVLGVIGLTAALNFSATFDLLGLGVTPGRYLVLRAFDNSGEQAMFDRVFHDLEPTERQQLYDARRRHKAAAILLHELAHNLGAEHQADPDSLMNAAYSDHAAAFDPTTRATILAGLAERLPRRAPARAPSMTIVVDRYGHAMLGGNALDDATLEGIFRLSLVNDRDAEIVVQGPPAAQVTITHVVELARGTGLAHVTVMPTP